ncbi:MerR family transcriptional regulator [Hoyosella rhizosphaerae]|uniref:MerR family transcriptional regulator n=1 Tax=Hoyosella rhizosphaerae TaxID=1755582 RepID=A0A916X9J8_9ACTN|nr:MerR family transcriptional regulator [Hoyosella rhizosphaerae]MBN4927006.1 MerR family transcriptional regulator [Hoyosella rhizosphaerae]GGC54777.1 MerR family transcriptional regulator [Hoyosella rhizosphaerae]
MQYSISQVAKMAGVSARTLRHYDETELLQPAAVSSNGYRWYGRRELRRLQRILLLRDLEVPLPQIKAILAGDNDEASALRRHLMLITAERDRLDRIATTIRRTLDDLEDRHRLPDEEFFRGLHEGRAQLATSLQERFGNAATNTLGAATDRTAHWSRSQYDRAAAEAQDLYGRLSRARQSGVDPASPEALDLVAEHYDAVRAMWPADPAAYHALADLIETDEHQRGTVAVYDPDLPSWLAAAIRTYATQRLAYRR